MYLSNMSNYLSSRSVSDIVSSPATAVYMGKEQVKENSEEQTLLSSSTRPETSLEDERFNTDMELVQGHEASCLQHVDVTPMSQR